MLGGHFCAQKKVKYTQIRMQNKIRDTVRISLIKNMEDVNMSFSFGLRDLVDPRKRLIMAVLLMALGLFCWIGKDWYQGVDRSDCLVVEATFDDCKYRSIDGAIDSNSIYLTFKDYSHNIDLRSSCADDNLTQRLMELKSGTKMKLLVYEKTNLAYEIKVNGDTWLDFNDARDYIRKNNDLITIVGCIMLGIGAILVVSSIVSLAIGRHNETEYNLGE